MYICHRVTKKFVPVTIIGGVRGGVFVLLVNPEQLEERYER